MLDFWRADRLRAASDLNMCIPLDQARSSLRQTGRMKGELAKDVPAAGRTSPRGSKSLDELPVGIERQLDPDDEDCRGDDGDPSDHGHLPVGGRGLMVVDGRGGQQAHPSLVLTT